MTNTTDLTKPVRTRSGLDVRILCTDAPGEFPVKGYWIDECGDAIDEKWNIDGAYFNPASSSHYDLVNVPETTKRYELCDVKSGFATLAAAQYHKSSGLSLIELTYEGDKLTAVKIVED